jgi:hypothetical protein
MITSAVMRGKQLIVTGVNFEIGALLFYDGAKMKKTGNDEENPTTVIVARKAINFIAPGQTVVLQIQNPSGSNSEGFTFTRPN